jgi:hypothetical protein
MAIDITKERLIPFDSAAGFLASGSRPTYSTWWRWWRQGIRGVHLETVLVGGRRLTTAEAVERFVAATTEAGSADALEMRRAIHQADHYSREAGS